MGEAPGVGKAPGLRGSGFEHDAEADLAGADVVEGVVDVGHREDSRRPA